MLNFLLSHSWENRCYWTNDIIDLWQDFGLIAIF